MRTGHHGKTRRQRKKQTKKEKLGYYPAALIVTFVTNAASKLGSLPFAPYRMLSNFKRLLRRTGWCGGAYRSKMARQSHLRGPNVDDSYPAAGGVPHVTVKAFIL